LHRNARRFWFRHASACADSALQELHPLFCRLIVMQAVWPHFLLLPGETRPVGFPNSVRLFLSIRYHGTRRIRPVRFQCPPACCAKSYPFRIGDIRCFFKNIPMLIQDLAPSSCSAPAIPKASNAVRISASAGLPSGRRHTIRNDEWPHSFLIPLRDLRSRTRPNLLKTKSRKTSHPQSRREPEVGSTGGDFSPFWGFHEV